MIVLALSDATAARVADLAGRIGLTPSRFLCDRVEDAFGNGRHGALDRPSHHGICVTLDDETADALNLAADLVGQTPSQYLAEQLSIAGSDDASEAAHVQPRPQSRSARRRSAARARVTRRSARSTTPETTPPDA